MSRWFLGNILLEYCEPCERYCSIYHEISWNNICFQFIVDVEDAKDANARSGYHTIDPVQVIGVSWKWLVKCGCDYGWSTKVKRSDVTND